MRLVSNGVQRLLFHLEFWGFFDMHLKAKFKWVQNNVEWDQDSI